MFASTLISVALATASLAMPTSIMKRTTPSYQCSGAGAFSNASTFLLTALNNTTPVNYTDPGATLEVETLYSNQVGDVYYAPLGYGPVGSFDPQTFTLVNGTLIPFLEDPSGGIRTADLNVTSGAPLGFAYGEYPAPDLPAAAAIYCGQADTDPENAYEYAALLVYGEAGFSMCANGTTPATVVWQATADNGGAYDFETCYDVRLQIVPV